MRIRFATGLTLAFALLWSAAWSAPLPLTIVVNGTRVVPYIPGATVPVTCGPNYACSVALDASEQINDIVCPASVKTMPNGWIVQQGSQGSRPMLYLLPKLGAPRTNLIVTTTRRVYQIELIPSMTAAIAQTAYVFIYPEDLAAAAKANATPEPTPTPDVIDYSFYAPKVENGKPRFLPTQVRREGDLTFIVLPDGNYPLPDVVSVDGTTQTPVGHTYQVATRTIVVQGIYPKLLLYVGTGSSRSAVSITRISS